MPQRPKVLNIIVLIFIGIVLSFPLQVAFLYGHEWDEMLLVLRKISALNIFLALALLMQIPLILRASRWLVLSLPLTALLVSWNNWVVAQIGHDFTFSTLLFATLGFFLLSGFVFLPSVRTLIHNPKKRWWLQALRKTISLPISIEPVRGACIETKTFDLSHTGAFIPINNWDQFVHPIRTGDIVSIKLNLGPLNRIGCTAEIIRQNSAMGHYPTGIGLRFLNLPRGQHRLLNRYIQQIPLSHTV